MAILNTTILLKQNKLRLTDGRKEILDLLQKSSVALSHSEIEKKLPSQLDRITTYRTLLSFKKKGMIHVIMDPQSGAARYLFSHPTLPKQHPHFKCTVCNMLICLETEISQPNPLVLPKGFQALCSSFVIEGLCDHCRRQVFLL